MAEQKNKKRKNLSENSPEENPNPTSPSELNEFPTIDAELLVEINKAPLTFNSIVVMIQEGLLGLLGTYWNRASPSQKNLLLTSTGEIEPELGYTLIDIAIQHNCVGALDIFLNYIESLPNRVELLQICPSTGKDEGLTPVAMAVAYNQPACLRAINQAVNKEEYFTLINAFLKSGQYSGMTTLAMTVELQRNRCLKIILNAFTLEQRLNAMRIFQTGGKFKGCDLIAISILSTDANYFRLLLLNMGINSVSQLSLLFNTYQQGKFKGLTSSAIAVLNEKWDFLYVMLRAFPYQAQRDKLLEIPQGAGNSGTSYEGLTVKDIISESKDPAVHQKILEKVSEGLRDSTFILSPSAFFGKTGKHPTTLGPSGDSLDKKESSMNSSLV
ncbi:MAG TPA: hypothetical protein VHE99_09410 [Gammaproteobacteria bacterium]|nr:hypothetical protein [Gammaproteobacteria bacterium]